MKITVETHSHTLASGHAYSTLKEMIMAAKEKRLEAIAITEHAPDMPGTCSLYYFQNYKVIPSELYGVKVLMGAELNIMDETGLVDLEDRLLAKLDLVVASIHSPCYSGGMDKEAVTRSYLNTMKNPHIDIIGHPDDGRFPIDYETLVKGAKETGTLLEVNNTSLSATTFRQGCRENIMQMLTLCKRYRAPIVLGSDAHIEFDVGNICNSLPVLEACEFPEELVANTSLEKLKSFILD